MSLKELPLMVHNRQPAAEVDDPKVTKRLTEWFTRAWHYIEAFTPIDDGALADPDTGLSRTQLLSLAVGFVGVDTAESRDNRTHTLVYTDPETGKSNYQTVCTPYYAPSSLLWFERDADGVGCRLRWKPTGEVLAETRYHARIFEASNHYYSRVSPDFAEMPTAAIISPYSTCAGGCLGCNRGAVSSFTPPPENYVSDHVAQLAADFDARGWDRAELISVNITTGCQPTETDELVMMLKLMHEYRRWGFSNASFFPFTYAIDSAWAMDALLHSGAAGFIGTVECFNDDERLRQWGKRKGGITFEQHLAKYQRAREVGFDIVETDYVLGADSYDETMSGIAAFDEIGTVVVPNIKRNYSIAQLDSNHPDIWDMGMRYVADAFHGCLDTYQHGTIKRRAARYTLDYLHRTGADGLTLRDLPIRHT